MEKKNVLHTERVSSKNKTYFLDLKEAENGNNFLVINQSKPTEEGSYERVKMILFEEDLERFSQALVKIMFYFKKQNTKAKREAYKEEVRKEYPNAYEPWTEEDEALLGELFQQGHQVEELMVHFKRNRGGIERRLEKLGMPSQAAAA